MAKNLIKRSRHMLDYLRENLPDYDTYAVSRAPKSSRGESTPVFVSNGMFNITQRQSFMLSKTPEAPASKSCHTMCARICSMVCISKKGSDTPFLMVANTHLDHFSKLARQEGLKLILNRIQTENGQAPFIITGDFNDVPESSVFRCLSQTAASCYDVIPPSERGQLLTYHHFTDAVKGRPIDYLFAGKGIEIIETKIIRDRRPDVMPSDHYPALVTVKI